MLACVATVATLSSCGYDYDSESVTLGRGDSHRGYKLSRVQDDGVQLQRSTGDGLSDPRFYSLVGRPHMRGSHSLGNNEHMRILSVDPFGQKAELEFTWLDWVGPLTMPPF